MNSVTSSDGTTIAFEKEGHGPALVYVDGAMSTRSSGSKPELVKMLAEHLTVFVYDRRGRGDSGDTLPYAVDREIEDIDVMLDAAGGKASLFGHSSGACLALDATVKLGEKVEKLAMYEAPYNDDQQAQKVWREYLRNLTEALASNRRGDAVALFMALVGLPAGRIEEVRQMALFSGMEAVAPTLAYDHTGIMGKDGTIPVDRAARVGVPTLVMAGGNGAPFMLETAKTLSKVIPLAKLRVLEGQTHEVQPEALAPALLEFFGD